MLNFRNTCLALTLVAASTASASASPLVGNGDFQTGNFTGWTVNESTNFPWSVAHSGSNFYASDGCVGQPCITGPMSSQSYLYQDIATVAGNTYSLTFDFGTNGAGNPMELRAYFGGTLAADLLNVAPLPTSTYTINGLVATENSTRLEFLGRQDPGFDYLDNISVIESGAPSAVPEPATLGMVGTGVMV